MIQVEESLRTRERSLSGKARDPVYHDLLFFLVSCSIVFWRRAPFLGQWDSFDYLKKIFTHQYSPLGFGRPAFIGYNMVLWEPIKWLLHPDPRAIESVVTAGVIFMGGLGVLAFSRFARGLFSGQSARAAVLALVMAPTYVAYAGSVMTEIPMFAAAMTAAFLLWREARSQGWSDLLAGTFFGLAIGMREQAVVLTPAYLWIVWNRRLTWNARIRTVTAFTLSTIFITLFSVLLVYWSDPPGFVPRMTTWLESIPRGRPDFWMNFEASFLWTVAACPGAWIGLLFAFLWRQFHAPSHNSQALLAHFSWCAGVSGIVCTIVLPLAILWRDADVQIHPRYAVVALPGALIVCTALYFSWFRSRRAALWWALLQLSMFGISQLSTQPFRDRQTEKRAYAGLVLDIVDHPALLIAGGNSSAFDYYRAIGLRPGWRISWSGWDWNADRIRAAVTDSLTRGEPIYLCDGPWAWTNLEGERLELDFLLREWRRREVAPGIKQIVGAK